MVGTLNPDGTEWAYNHRKFAINIPRGLLKQAQKTGKDDQWVTFSLGHRDAAGREEADDFKGGGLARMARCMLPPSDKIFKKVLKQLNKFKKGSWIYENKETAPGSTNEDGIGPGPGPIQNEWVYVCTAYWVYKACFRDPETNILYDCEYTVLGCSQTEMVPGEGGANNGGAPDNDTGTDTGNSCEPDEKGAVPISCVEETEPCDTGDPAVDSLSTSPEMQGLWVESFGPASNPLPHNQRQETALMVITTQTGYQFEQIPPGPQTSACKFDYSQASIPSNIVALVHTHPFNDGVTLNEPGCSGVVDNDDVSNGDQAVVEAIRDNPQLPAIPMYVMDPNKLRVIDPSNPSQYADTFDRCGY